MSMKHSKILIEPTAERKDKKNGTKTENDVVHIKKDGERDIEG